MVFLDKLVIQRADDMQSRENQEQRPQQIFMNFSNVPAKSLFSLTKAGISNSPNILTPSPSNMTENQPAKGMASKIKYSAKWVKCDSLFCHFGIGTSAGALRQNG